MRKKLGFKLIFNEIFACGRGGGGRLSKNFFIEFGLYELRKYFLAVDMCLKLANRMLASDIKVKCKITFVIYFLKYILNDTKKNVCRQIPPPHEIINSLV